MFMRKIKTSKEIAKEKRRKQIVLGIVMVALLVFSTAGYAFSSYSNDNTVSQQTKLKYSGYTFEKQGYYWVADINGQNFYFQYSPEETENVSVSGIFNLNDYSDTPLYFVGNNPAVGEIFGNLQGSVLRTQEVCLNEIAECEGDFPVKNCEDNVIIFLGEESEDKVYESEGCVYISGNLIKSSDAFLYKILGVS